MSGSVAIRRTQAADFPSIIALSERTYAASPPWSQEQLASHLKQFPEGQLVAVEDGAVVGMAASLIVFWDDYDLAASWRDFTDRGYFTNHDPERGHTLYGAEVMVDETLQGRGIGGALYAERERLVRSLGLWRIRAGARLRGYHRFVETLTPAAYVEQVVEGTIRDPTLSFQLSRGFRVLATVEEYLHRDPESRGYAAVIEWSNPEQRQSTT